MSQSFDPKGLAVGVPPRRMSVAEKLKLDSERGRRRQDPAEVAQQAAQVMVGACPRGYVRSNAALEASLLPVQGPAGQHFPASLPV